MRDLQISENLLGPEGEVLGFLSGEDFGDEIPMDGDGLVGFEVGEEEGFEGDGFNIVISF